MFFDRIRHVSELKNKSFNQHFVLSFVFYIVDCYSYIQDLGDITPLICHFEIQPIT